MRLGVRDVARQFGVPEKVVFRWVEEEGLPVSRVDGQYSFTPAGVFEWATARGMRIPPALFREPGSADREPLPTLTEALLAGGIMERVPGADKRAVLGEIIRRVDLPAGVDREGLLQVVLARERLGSTGIGEGIAIPHVRNPIVLRLERPMLVLGLLERPVDFAALDGRPVHSVFLVITPTTRSHLHILSRLGYVLQDRSLRDLLAQRAEPARIEAAIEAAESRIAAGGAG
jgi:PTS system nitrogen regulatory IIA component